MHHLVEHSDMHHLVIHSDMEYLVIHSDMEYLVIHLVIHSDMEYLVEHSETCYSYGMATARVSRAPVLDRVITLSVSGSAPGASFRYDDDISRITGVREAGDYYWAAGRLLVHPFDADRVALPTISVGDTIAIAWGDGAYVVMPTLTAVTFSSGGFGNQTARPDLRWDSDVTPIIFAQTTEAMQLTVGSGVAIVPRKVHAARRDVSVRDELLTTQTLRAILDRAVYTIRNTGVDLVAAGDRFTDEDGATRTIEGVSQIGRQRYLEILARVGT